MSKSYIPKMTYIVRLGNVNKKVLKECLTGIRRQSNVEKIVILKPGMMMQLHKDTWCAIIESDVYLLKNWIERMWKYHNTGDVIMGRVASHPRVRLYKEKTIKIGKPTEPYLQSVIWKAGAIMTASEALYSKNTRWVQVPVVDFHCPSYKHNPFYQGTLDPPVSIERIIRTLLGGIKIAIKETHWIFAYNAIMRGAGMLMRRIL